MHSAYSWETIDSMILNTDKPDLRDFKIKILIDDVQHCDTATVLNDVQYINMHHYTYNPTHGVFIN